MPPDDALFLTPPEAARLLRVKVQKILGFIRDGELKASNLAKKRGGRPRWRISRIDLEMFLNGRAAVPSKPVRPIRRRRKSPEVIEFF